MSPYQFSLFIFQLKHRSLCDPARVSVSREALDRRSFVYTRQQWTGKSPKQFLNDWVRKNLPQTSAISFEKMSTAGNLWRAR